MTLPASVAEPSTLDPLLLLPLPENLPPSPLPDLDPLLNALEAKLAEPQSSAEGMTLLTAHMRQVTRRAQILLNAARVGAAEARERLDHVDVDLRGVEYERNRIREEIERCEGYKAAYKEMDLPSIEDFRASAGEEILVKLPAETEDEHEFALTIARLEHELGEIEKREARAADMSKERDGVILSKKEIKRKFDASETYVNDLARSASAVASKTSSISKVASNGST